ncbi:F0F1 ATP synthase subunit delta [Aquibacillus halophilus]|uniref:ATP synthase subunit delta n=1 Tax=Aquibacillus halophilus TaxID=930132 RepID=A0A6A8DJM4_9BACI|nr:F0F1 ATP synthase subunit delta [Aquibacillus halophilus]MRH43961.1 F0F1 ATP synthase subunit delta [Aquibacillus halophilus]
MSKANVSKRYAEALFQLAQEKNKLDFLEPELLIVKEVFYNNKELNAFLKHPKVNSDKKKQLIDEAFKGFSSEVINTLKVLVDRNNEEAISSVVDHFIALVHDAKRIAEAKVYSIRELSDDEKKQLSDVFSKKLNLKTLTIDNHVDPTILGGIKLKIGNTIFDGTIKGKLERLERNIVSAN